MGTVHVLDPNGNQAAGAYSFLSSEDVATPYVVTIDGTSRLITALTGGPTTIPDSALRVTFKPFCDSSGGPSGVIHGNYGATASSATWQLSPSGESCPNTAALLRTMRVISESGASIQAMMYVVTPR